MATIDLFHASGTFPSIIAQELSSFFRGAVPTASRPCLSASFRSKNLFTVVTLTFVNELFVDLLFCAAISALLVWALKGGGKHLLVCFPPSNLGYLLCHLMS